MFRNVENSRNLNIERLEQINRDIKLGWDRMSKEEKERLIKIFKRMFHYILEK